MPYPNNFYPNILYISPLRNILLGWPNGDYYRLTDAHPQPDFLEGFTSLLQYIAQAEGELNTWLDSGHLILPSGWRSATNFWPCNIRYSYYVIVYVYEFSAFWSCDRMIFYWVSPVSFWIIQLFLLQTFFSWGKKNWY